MSVSSEGGRVRYRCRPTPDGPAAGPRASVYLAESRVLAAIAPWTDSIYVTTAVRPKVAMTLIGE